MTSHGFIPRAIDAQTSEAETQAALRKIAEERWQRFRKGGTAVPGTDDEILRRLLALNRERAAQA